MSNRTRSVLMWTIAFMVTLFFSVFQRMTGPTYPVKGTESLDGLIVSYRLQRSQETKSPLPVRIRTDSSAPSLFLEYRRLNSDDRWGENTLPLSRRGDGVWEAGIPSQPVAGKVEYRVFHQSGERKEYLMDGRSVVARFKGGVPPCFLIPHVILMFVSILLTVRLGLELFFWEGRYYRLVNITFLVFLLGAGVLGPVVQYYAFGDAWAGFPLGTDLTDNKALVALVFWILAVILKRKSKVWVALAVVVMLLVYLLPHSLLGSELDYRTGEMKNRYSRLSVFQNPSGPVPPGLMAGAVLLRRSAKAGGTVTTSG